MRKTQIINSELSERSANLGVRRSVVLSLVFVFALTTILFTREQNASSSKVTITEFSDFQCPYCKRAASVVAQVRQVYGDRVKFVFKQMPLPMHTQAFKAAQASVCAQEQGKFWEFHDRAFAASDLSADTLNRIAAKVGLNRADFSLCLSSNASRAAVEKDMTEAARLGVSGTPTFFVNSKAVKGAATFATLSQEIDKAMTRLHHPMLPSPYSKEDLFKPENAEADSRVRAVPGAETNADQKARYTSESFTNPANKLQQQASTITSAAGVTLSPAIINFGYQLVGTTSPQIVETVTNAGTTPLVITDISVSGRDRGDFAPSYSFTLPVTVAPGNSIVINLTFTPALPWRAGTRNARLEVSEKKNSQYVSLTGIGATCGGPLPACSSGCADADGDGLNDAWEMAGGIDLNNDGKIDSQNDTPLTGADPNKPDIYVQYDWMDYGTLDFPCTGDGDCPQFGNSALGTATCTGPKILSSSLPHTCVQSCNSDTDCQALVRPGEGGDSHASDQCISNVCQHTHDPELITPGAIQAVVDRFAARGFNLHVLRGQALPHSHVLTLRTLSEMTDGCEGGSVGSGTAGVGEYAESFFDLKEKYFDARRSFAYHYMIFSHYSQCDTFEHCADDAHPGSCPSGTAKVAFSGYAEINGNDFMVSLGSFINDFEALLSPGPPGGITFGQLLVGGTFMHELGHNLGLRHGGGVSATPDPASCHPPDCEDLPIYKPNYLSVMNYLYQTGGIQSASAPGEFIPVDTRLDYSTQVLPTVAISDGVTGVLNELNLDETVPFGLTSGNADLFSFTDGKCGGHQWPTHAPVDWDGSGIAGDNSAAVADLNPEANLGGECFAPAERHRGHIDWGPTPGQSIFRYAFQCTSFFADGQGVAPTETLSSNELTAQMAKEAHVLYPTRPVNIEITPGCEDKTIASGRRGEFSVAILGSADLDVRKVEPTSLRFHGASPLRTELSDINGDGNLDLVVVFDMASVSLNPQAKTARLTGWLKNSQAFIGEDRVTIVP